MDDQTLHNDLTEESFPIYSVDEAWSNMQKKLDIEMPLHAGQGHINLFTGIHWISFFTGVILTWNIATYYINKINYKEQIYQHNSFQTQKQKYLRDGDKTTVGVKSEEEIKSNNQVQLRSYSKDKPDIGQHLNGRDTVSNNDTLNGANYTLNILIKKGSFKNSLLGESGEAKANKPDMKEEVFAYPENRKFKQNKLNKLYRKESNRLSENNQLKLTYVKIRALSGYTREAPASKQKTKPVSHKKNDRYSEGQRQTKIENVKQKVNEPIHSKVMTVLPPFFINVKATKSFPEPIDKKGFLAKDKRKNIEWNAGLQEEIEAPLYNTTEYLKGPAGKNAFSLFIPGVWFEMGKGNHSLLAEINFFNSRSLPGNPFYSADSIIRNSPYPSDTIRLRTTKNMSKEFGPSVGLSYQRFYGRLIIFAGAQGNFYSSGLVHKKSVMNTGEVLQDTYYKAQENEKSEFTQWQMNGSIGITYNTGNFSIGGKLIIPLSSYTQSSSGPARPLSAAFLIRYGIFHNK
ncbi:MAG TPA: hypothetical protein VFQ58_01770 [Flavisolibacter sp.]|nr:hypothetical protein [Flavisolibacter sp.]